MIYNFVLYKEISKGYMVLDQWTRSFESDDDAAGYIIDYNFMLNNIGYDAILSSPDIPFEVKYEYKILEMD